MSVSRGSGCWAITLNDGRIFVPGGFSNPTINTATDLFQ